MRLSTESLSVKGESKAGEEIVTQSRHVRKGLRKISGEDAYLNVLVRVLVSSFFLVALKTRRGGQHPPKELLRESPPELPAADAAVVGNPWPYPHSCYFGQSNRLAQARVRSSGFADRSAQDPSSRAPAGGSHCTASISEEFFAKALRLRHNGA